MKNRRVFELRLGKLGLVLFISGMSLLLFSGFLAGIVVGKHMEAYPERYASGIPELIRDRLLITAPKAEKNVSQATELEKQDEPAGEEEKFDLTFYDTLGAKKEGTAMDIRGGAVNGALPEISAGRSGQTGNAMPTGSPVVAPERKAEIRTPVVSVGDAELKKSTFPPDGSPTVETGANSAPAGEIAQRGNGLFEIQVAAYHDKQKAEKMIEKLGSLGFKSRMVMKELPGKGTWYRVILDGFESRERAQEAAERMGGKVRGLKCVIRASTKNGH